MNCEAAKHNGRRTDKVTVGAKDTETASGAQGRRTSKDI